MVNGAINAYFGSIAEDGVAVEDARSQHQLKNSDIVRRNTKLMSDE
jgi:hypothetical protein